MVYVPTISSLCQRRRKLTLALEKMEARTAALRATLEGVEAELRAATLLDSLPDLVARRRKLPMKRAELSRLCLASLRTATRPLYTRDVAAFITTAKGADPLDIKLRLSVCSRALNSLRVMERRGWVTRIGRGKGVRWMVPG